MFSLQTEAGFPLKSGVSLTIGRTAVVLDETQIFSYVDAN